MCIHIRMRTLLRFHYTFRVYFICRVPLVKLTHRSNSTLNGDQPACTNLVIHSALVRQREGVRQWSLVEWGTRRFSLPPMQSHLIVFMRVNLRLNLLDQHEYA